MVLDPNDIKDIVLNTDKPCVIKNLDLNWKCLNSINLTEWCSYLNTSFIDGIPFEVATIKHNKYPQWERHRQICRMTMEQFINSFHLTENPGQWATYSYKSLNVLPKECQEGVNFDRFGFPDMEYVNFWFGSKAAHTSAHFDTYGCNIVVQLYGSKSWLLFPPHERLTPTRVPYEESSVYCKENFYSPNVLDAFNNIVEPHHIILNAGDALIIPRHWWHYAENLETSLSINTWVPLDVDVDSQIDECIVQTQISEVSRGLSENLRSAVINPNEMETMQTFNLSSQLNLMKNLLPQNNSTNKRFKLNNHNYKYLSADRLAELLEKCKDNVQPLDCISKEMFYKILTINSNRFDSSIVDSIEGCDEYKFISSFINSICKPNVVQMVKNNLINEMTP